MARSCKDLYDFPMSHGCWRAMCQLHGEQVPPNVDVEPYTLTEEEHRQEFIKWQDEQHGDSPILVSPLKPIPMHAPPAIKRLKAIDV